MAENGTESAWSEGFGFSVGEVKLTYVYKKITTDAELESGNYLIVYENNQYVFNGSLTSLDATSNFKTVSISDSKIAWTEEIEGYSFTYDAGNGSFQSASGYYIGRASSETGNGLSTSKTTVYSNSVSFNNGNAVITSAGKTTLQFNSTSGQTRFRFFGSNQQAIQLYKKVAE